MINTDTLTLLRACDTHGYERPSGFDVASATVMVDGLKKALDASLPGQVQGPYEDQDCTYFARLRLPSQVNVSGDECDLYISNFGNMVAVQNEDTVLPEYLAAIKTLAEQHCFQWLSETDLLSDYSGESYPGFSSWWHRFFDYV